MGIIHQDFVIQKSYFSSLQNSDFFHSVKTSPIIVTNTALHFNNPGLSRPDKRKFLCWQISHIVGRFHAASANFTQRRITPRSQTKRKATKTNRNIYFKHKNPKQRHCDRKYSSEEELLHCDFHIKSRLQIKFIVFPTNNQP